jgi:histidinol phosphatase-like enzyme
MTHEPTREVELWLSPASAPAKMMKILEAEGGTKITARLASPHHRTGGHHLG